MLPLTCRLVVDDEVEGWASGRMSCYIRHRYLTGPSVYLILSGQKSTDPQFIYFTSVCNPPNHWSPETQKVCKTHGGTLQISPGN